MSPAAHGSRIVDAVTFEICARLANRHGVASSRQAISQHLDVLEGAGLIDTRRDGRWKLHTLNPAPLETMLDRWRRPPATPATWRPKMRIHLASILVDDQAKALAFYTDVLGFLPKEDVDMGGPRWLTVVSPEAPDGTELVLEPDAHPAAGPFKRALVADGIPFTSFAVDDCTAEYERLMARGVVFTQPPVAMGPVTTAVFDDTCGNLIQIASMNG